jgi:hypothetical protein
LTETTLTGGFQAKPKFVESGLTQGRNRSRRKKRALSHSTIYNQLFDFPVEDLARQITYTEARLFRRIHPRELMKGAWQHPEKASRAPHVVPLVDQFNNISFSIAYMICTCKDLKDRCKLIGSFIELAQVILLLVDACLVADQFA